MPDHLAFYRVTAFRADVEIGHCVVEAGSPEAAEPIGMFEMSETLRFNPFDLAVRFEVADADGPSAPAIPGNAGATVGPRSRGS